MSLTRLCDGIRSDRSALIEHEDLFPVRDDDSVFHDEHVPAGNEERN